MEVTIIVTILLVLFVLEYQLVGISKHFLNGEPFLGEKGKGILCVYQFKKVVFFDGNKGRVILSSVFHKTHTVFKIATTSKEIIVGKTLLTYKLLVYSDEIVSIQLKRKFGVYNIKIEYIKNGVCEKLLFSDFVIFKKSKIEILKFYRCLKLVKRNGKSRN